MRVSSKFGFQFNQVKRLFEIPKGLAIKITTNFVIKKKSFWSFTFKKHEKTKRECKTEKTFFVF